MKRLEAGRGVPVRAIAFYLPQYHPIPENDAWWRPGFTEWTNVVRARPQFVGHEQPHLPGELGFYDLRVPEVRERQAALARTHGIAGFCYHYYWFGGRRLLERPLDEIHRLGTPDFPFCVCWANENWSRRWDGSEHDVLLAQQHSARDDEALLRSLLPLFADRRYIRIGGRPLFIVYRPGILPDAAGTAERWRAMCVSEGLPEPYLVAAQSFGLGDPRPLGFDAAVEFPPHGVGDVDERHDLQRDERFTGRVFDYETFARRMLERPPGDYTRFRCVMPGWDNTARRKTDGIVFYGSSPELYEWWLHSAVALAQAELPEDRRLVFINAWNEWGEGCHLEPDDRYGDAYLRHTRRALAVANTPVHAPLVSVVVATFNQAAMLTAALRSVVEQTYENLEVVVVDDGSSDETSAVLAAFRARHSRHLIRVLSKEHGGTPAALNDGVRAAEGEYVAVLEDGCTFHADRLRRLVDAVRRTGARFAFSRGGYVDAAGRRVPPGHPVAEALREKQSRVAEFPALGYALIDFDLTMGAANLFFERSLFHDVGEFDRLQHMYHWDWVLRALRFGSPVFVERDLCAHRLPDPAARAVVDAEIAETLARFFDERHAPSEKPPGYPSRERFGDYHDAFVRERGLIRYVSGGFAGAAKASVAVDRP